MNQVRQSADDGPETAQSFSDDTRLNAVTFFGSAVARVGAHHGDPTYWDYDTPSGSESTIDFEFRTYDPIGVYLFKGVQSDSVAYMCVEMFDGYLYFRYNLGAFNGHRSVGAMCRGQPLNNGQPHRITLTISKRFRANESETRSDNSIALVISCDNNTEAEIYDSYTKTLDGYLYVGGVDSVERLPWYVWSRRFFNGAFTYFKINGVYVDFHDFFAHKVSYPEDPAVANRVKLENTCNPRNEEPPEICAQNQGGKCWVDRSLITDGNEYFCDCGSLTRDAIHCVPDYYEMSFGANRVAWTVQLTSTWTSHCDDIMISFRTNASSDDSDHGFHSNLNQRRKRQATDVRYATSAIKG